MNDLDKLAQKYGADKFGKHSYTPFYHQLFKDKRNKIETVLEIGVAEGASLFMWRDYFPNAMIYGAEIDQKRVDLQFGQERILIIQCDQSNKHSLEHMSLHVRNPELVIDDGSHKPEDQLNTCLLLMSVPAFRNATYIIEDVADENAEKILEGLKEYDVETHKFSQRYDDRIIIVKHKI